MSPLSSVYQPNHQENPGSEERQISQPTTSSVTQLPTNDSLDGPSGSFFQGSSNLAIKGGNFNQTYGHHTNVTVHNVHYNQYDTSLQHSFPLPSLLPSQTLNRNPASPPIENTRRSQQHASISTTIYAFDNSNMIYECHRGPKRRGFPLWIPEPNRTLPMSYRRKGINIGDVGIITPSGGFSFLLNICLPHDDPINPATLPEGFAPIYPSIIPTDIREYFEFKPESYLASASIEKTHNDPPFRGLSFATSSAEGAILAFPDGAIARDLDNVRRFRDYAEANIENWYRYVNGPRGREAKNGDVRLIIDCDKATSWEQHLRHIPLYKWEYTGLAETRVEPDLQEIEDLKRGDDSGLAVEGKYWNQCLFMRTLNITLSEDVFTKIDRELDFAFQKLYNKGGSGTSSTDARKFGAQTCVADQQSETKSAAETESTSQRQPLGPVVEQMAVGERVTITRSPSAPILHPVDFLNRLLLQKVPNCRVVITQDEDWCSIIKEDDAIMPSPSEIAERVLATHHIRDENGVVFLESKMGRKSALRYRQIASNHSVEDHIASRSLMAASSSSTGTTPLVLSKRDDNPVPEDVDIDADIAAHGIRLKPFPYDLVIPVLKGVTVQTIVPGDGITFPKKGDKITIDYVGTLMNGIKFDSSRDRGSPFQTEIGTGKVIKGWDEGVLRLSLGQKALLTVTPNLAYGSRGFPPTIPPNSTLKFEVELLKINSNPISMVLKLSSG